MKLEEAIGVRVRERREHMKMTQQDLGAALGTWLDKPWPRQAVWSAERGARAFTAAELVALAILLEVSPAYLLTPPLNVGEVALPSGASTTILNVGPAQSPDSEDREKELLKAIDIATKAKEQAQAAQAAQIVANHEFRAAFQRVMELQGEDPDRVLADMGQNVLDDARSRLAEFAHRQRVPEPDRDPEHDRMPSRRTKKRVEQPEDV